MKKIVLWAGAFVIAVLVLIAAIAASASPAGAWEIDKMNIQVEKTNVVIGDFCSGTVIDRAERLVLTANHCIEQLVYTEDVEQVDPKTGEVRTVKVQKKRPLTVTTNRWADYEVVASETHLAKIVAFQKDIDVAVIQIADKTFMPDMQAPLAPDSYKFLRGQKIWLVGNPMVLYDNSVVDGVISAPQRKIDYGTGVEIKMFQYSANTVGGNSGGAIYNDDGQLIGTVSGGYRGSAVQFAVPISFTKELLRKAKFNIVADRK